MGIPFGVKKVDGDINREEVLAMSGFDADVIATCKAKVRF